MSPTLQLSHGWTSSAEWTGVPLASILREVGLQPGGAWILAEGADAAGLNRSIPTAKAIADGLLVYAANGEDLRPSQGYPVRLLLPGFEGNMNIKWLRRLKIGREPWHTRWDTPYYGDLMPDGTAREFTFVMEAKSVITSPSGGQRLPGPGFVEISGLAWSGRGGSRGWRSPLTAGKAGHRPGCRSRCYRWPGRGSVPLGSGTARRACAEPGDR